MGQKKSRMLSIVPGDQTDAVTPNIPTPMVCQAEAVTPEILTPEVCHCLCSLPSGAEAASSFFYSARIAKLSEQRSKFSNQLDFDVESSTSHWTTRATTKSDESNEQVHNRLQNRVVFEKLKEHLEWGPFFRRHPYELEVGAKIAEGGQAEIYEALGTNKDDWRCIGGSGKVSLVVKAFKDGFPLNQLQTLCPPGIAYAPFPHNIDDPRISMEHKHFTSTEGGGSLCWALGAQLLKDGRFAFIFDRYEGDLRKRIDENMLRRNGCPPFSFEKTYRCIISIARGMCRLHDLGDFHNDLKAANVLVERRKIYGGLVSFGVDVLVERRKIYGGLIGFGVADFESSVGIEGTGFWRAPEVLLALKNRKLNQETFTQCTTQQSDVYSFAMTCYEIITGRMPFEGYNVQNYDIVLGGGRPTLPSYPFARYNNLLRRCWHQDPQGRPSFAQIVEDLEALLTNLYSIRGRCNNSPNCEFWRNHDFYFPDG